MVSVWHVQETSKRPEETETQQQIAPCWAETDVKLRTERLLRASTQPEQQDKPSRTASTHQQSYYSSKEGARSNREPLWFKTFNISLIEKSKKQKAPFHLTDPDHTHTLRDDVCVDNSWGDVRDSPSDASNRCCWLCSGPTGPPYGSGKWLSRQKRSVCWNLGQSLQIWVSEEDLCVYRDDPGGGPCCLSFSSVAPSVQQDPRLKKKKKTFHLYNQHSFTCGHLNRHRLGAQDSLRKY